MAHGNDQDDTSSLQMLTYISLMTAPKLNISWLASVSHINFTGICYSNKKPRVALYAIGLTLAY